MQGIVHDRAKLSKLNIGLAKRIEQFEAQQKWKHELTAINKHLKSQTPETYALFRKKLISKKSSKKF